MDRSRNYCGAGNPACSRLSDGSRDQAGQDLPHDTLRPRSYAAALLAFSILTTSCGYHVGGHTDLLPKTIKVIAIPGFGNATTHPKLPVLLAADVKREFISRTRYLITADPDQADAVLSGVVVNLVNYPNVLDPVTSRATGVQVAVTMQITLTDRRSGAVLFTLPAAEFRERYEIAINPQQYFEENDTAMMRLSRDVSRSVVSAILASF
jgi:hypothetical protein